MTTVPIDLARAVAASECAAAGVTLVTPDSPSLLRSAAYLSVAALTPLTVAEARERVSLYVPSLVSDVAALIAGVTSLAPMLDKPAVLVGERAWSDGNILAGVIGHELGHRRRDVATRGACGVVCSALWGVTYLAHPAVRLWEEGTCMTSDVTAAVILRDLAPDAAADEAQRALRSIYNADPASLAIGGDAIESCAASLRAGVLHGKGTAIESVLRALVAKGWMPSTRWAKVLA